MHPRSVPALLLCLVLAVGCTGTSAPEDPNDGLPPAEDTLQSVATALQTKQFGVVTTLQADPVKTRAELDVMVAGMGATEYEVRPGAIMYDASTRTATGKLQWEWKLPSPWLYETYVTMALSGEDVWQWFWEPSIVVGGGSRTSKMSLTQAKAKRGRILGNGGKPLVMERDVVRVGLDKSQLEEEQYVSSATRVAKLVEVDVDSYVKLVKSMGSKAFVEAIVLRGLEAPPGLELIPGGFAKNDTMMLAPTRTFAQQILGHVGQATAEDLERSRGKIRAGDLVGHSGLQAWHNETLAGVSGHQVTLVKRTAEEAEVGPELQEEPTASASAESEILPAVIRDKKPVAGKDLTITLDEKWQTRAEKVLNKNTKTPVAAAIVQPSTGKLLALATNEAAKGQPVANWGHYPPGSTFKVVSSLALLRSGMTPESKDDCPKTLDAHNRIFRNYPEYPASANGSITMSQAIANSCNTWFVNATADISSEDLAKAAGSLGIGTDYDAGFQSFFGSVPEASGSEFAAATFGQGKVEVSPMIVAGMSASVAQRATVVPWLVTTLKPTTTALTSEEGTQLQTLMQAAASSPGYAGLKGTLKGAKTGTAEFGPAGEVKNHIWMTGYTDADIAIAVFADEGRYGSDLAPMVVEILS